MSGVETQTLLVLKENPESISIVVTVYFVWHQQYDRLARLEHHLLPKSNTQVHKIPGEIHTCTEDQSNGLFFSLLSSKHFFFSSVERFLVVTYLHNCVYQLLGYPSCLPSVIAIITRGISQLTGFNMHFVHEGLVCKYSWNASFLVKFTHKCEACLTFQYFHLVILVSIKFFQLGIILYFLQ